MLTFNVFWLFLTAIGAMLLGFLLGRLERADRKFHKDWERERKEERDAKPNS